MVTAAVFAPCLANGFVDYDDPVHMPLCLGDLPSPRFERADGTVRERVARLDPADELARRNLMRAEEMK